eukprot:3880428-Rhodomonas_salina.1
MEKKDSRVKLYVRCITSLRAAKILQGRVTQSYGAQDQLFVDDPSQDNGASSPLRRDFSHKGSLIARQVSRSRAPSPLGRA